MKVKTKLKLMLPITKVVQGIVLMDARNEVITGLPFPSGWFPSAGDSLELIYAPASAEALAEASKK